jgi:hypothetical protein
VRTLGSHITHRDLNSDGEPQDGGSGVADSDSGEHDDGDTELTGMTRGPQSFFAKIPGLDAGYRLMTRVLPLGRGVLVEREGTVFVR